MIKIKMTPTEMMIAAEVGAVRRVTGIQEGMNADKHHARSDWATDIDGALAEMAFAKHMNVYWEATNRSFKDPDVSGHQVRSTRHMDGCLIVRPNDAERPQDAFVFAITQPPTVWLVGYRLCADCMQDGFWNKDSWWVGQSFLHTLDDLRRD